MSNPAKAKGDRAELEVQGLLRDLLGVPARRKLGAGRLDDTGDIEGVNDTVIQVASYTDIARAIREKLPACEAQQARAHATFGATFIRRPGGKYVVVLTPEQWATYVRESLAHVGQRECVHLPQDASFFEPYCPCCGLTPDQVKAQHDRDDAA